MRMCVISDYDDDDDDDDDVCLLTVGMQVDGPLLKKLDDEMLEKDLKVASKLHRTKLLLHIHHRIEGS